MKITSTEEYGLRILVQIGRASEGELTIAEIAEKENLTHANVAKICRLLRIAKILESSKGHTGGYRLASQPSEIALSKVMSALGEPLYGSEFCEKFSGSQTICTHTLDCSIRSVWKVVQTNINDVLQKLTLQDMIGSEEKLNASCGVNI